MRELKGFRRVPLGPGEARSVEFSVTPAMDITDAVPIYNEAIEFVEGAGL